MRAFISFVLAVTVMAAGNPARADEASLTVQGSIYAAPCTLGPNSSTVTLRLGRLSIVALQAPKSVDNSYQMKVSTIRLVNCPAGTRKVEGTFTGVADPDEVTTYKNEGTAENVSIQLISDHVTGGQVVGSGTSIVVAVKDAVAEIPVKARPYSAKGEATPGTLKATIGLTLDYQ